MVSALFGQLRAVEALTDRSSSPTPEELRIGEAAGSMPTTDLARCFLGLAGEERGKDESKEVFS